MVHAETIAEADGDAWLGLYEQGLSLRSIAGEVGQSYRAVREGIAGARLRKSDGQTGRHAKAFGLVLSFGSSCKPLALLTCRDVHPGGEIPRDSRICCAACHESGLDHRPGYTLTAAERLRIAADRRRLAEDIKRLEAATTAPRKRGKRRRRSA